jgi:RNA polymerase sigma-70 factor (ECF subfamily)
MALETDAELMLRVKAGDEASFDILLEKYRTPVVKFIQRMVQNSAAAEELAQDVFLRVYRAREGYEPSARFTTWLFRIATHIALNALRDGRKERNVQSLDAGYSGAGNSNTAPGGSWSDTPIEVGDTRATIEEFLVESAEVREIRSAVMALPGKQRAAVLMHKYHELDYKQIAESLGCSESAVKSLLFRAYETLRQKLIRFAAPSAAEAAGE